MVHYDNLNNAEIILALSIHLTLLKTWNWVYKFWVRPELHHDVFRHTGHCITASGIATEELDSALHQGPQA